MTLTPIGMRQNAFTEVTTKKKLSPLELQNRAKRDSLLLARKRTVAALETTTGGGYRTMLEQALQHLDSELASLG